MTSEIDAIKTNELVRRRKLRLQQVREQSNNIAKKIRQRAKVERLKQVDELDAKKQQDYFKQQEQLVKKLEEFYTKGIENIGASHKNALDLKQQENRVEKVDPSKQRGREAAAELRKKRQEKLDEQKKILDRKLHAREAANEVSREKSASVAQKLSKAAIKDSEGQTSAITTEATNKHVNSEATCTEERCKDMTTQWDHEPNEWEPNIPVLSLPQDDKDSVKETNNNVESKTNKNKHLDLFALSEEMPSSLRGGLFAQEELAPVKPSLTLVSEYLQTRSLRLRESQTTDAKKKNIEELESIKQTIVRARAAKAGTACLCQVHDEEIMPVPSWEAEDKCGVCSYNLHDKYLKRSRTCCNVHMNIFGPTKPLQTELIPSPILRGCTPFRRNRMSVRSSKDIIAKTSKSSCGTSTAAKKSSISMYDHSTRNVRNIPVGGEALVVRDLHMDDDDDAYSLAMKESSTSTQKNKFKKGVENRSKVAMNKHDVEKEYRETMSFLKTLPKNNGDRPIRRAFMDEDRQKSLIENRQKKLQQEYKKAMKDCKKPNCRNKTRTKSPGISNFDNSDFKYSWMPVPEKEGSLAIHTIPTSLVEGKTGNTVKFTQVDSYHEYRSRHKHTPPTKDTSHVPRQFTEPQCSQNSSEAELESTSETSVSEVISLEMRGRTKENKNKDAEKISDAERIIIYKILDSKNEKAKRTKIMKKIAKSLTILNQQTKTSSHPDKGISFEELKEGVYETVNENGTGMIYNVMSCYKTNIEMWRGTTEQKPWWDNIASMYFSKNENNEVDIELTEDEKLVHPCSCSKKLSKHQPQHTGTPVKCQRWERGDDTHNFRPSQSPSSACKGGHQGTKLKYGSIPEAPRNTPIQPSATTSMSSFKTAATDKAGNPLPNGGFIKLIDNGGEEAGKLFVGASDFLRNDAYEVVIQLRKKRDEQEERESLTKEGKVNEEQQETNLPESVKAGVQTDRSNYNVAKHANSSDTTKYCDTPVGNTDFPENRGAVSSLARETSTSDCNNVQKSEKGIETSFQNNLTDVELHKTEWEPKPVTSACTQTSWSSPEHRPVLLHMSSTTSTAYMSPPDMILPKFLKRDYTTPDEGIYVRGNFERKNREKPISDLEYSEEYECSCIKCCHAKKIVCKTSGHRCRKSTGKTNGVATPPNTARRGIDDPFILLEKYNKICSCRKCRRNNKEETTSNTKINSKKHTLMSKSHSSTSNKKDRWRKAKSNLNPIIREYVNKLLTLNKASHRAVQVIDQDCSNVTTPGSSVINVSSNNNSQTKGIDNKLSLEQIKTMVAEQILKEIDTKSQASSKHYNDFRKDIPIKTTKLPKMVKKKNVHKIKSFNISKNFLKPKKSTEHKQPQYKATLSSSCYKEAHINVPPIQINRVRSKSSPTPRSASASSEIRGKSSAQVANNILKKRNSCAKTSSNLNDFLRSQSKKSSNLGESVDVETTESFCRAQATSTSKPEIPGLCDMGTNHEMPPLNLRTPSNMSTQTSVNSEISMKFDTDKIQAMEKIADLTDKCTKRLSNLAKVLEEVRRNKSLAYSQISTSDDSGHNSVKNSNTHPAAPLQSFHDLQKSIEPKSPEGVVPGQELINKSNQGSDPFIPFLADIPKPDSFNIPSLDLNLSTNSLDKSNSSSQANNNYDNIKVRGKPPPALSRIHLKNVHDNLIPHELSTVVEVDSPMSLKLKSQTSRNDTKLDAPESSYKIDNATYKADRQSEERDPDILTSQVDLPADFRISHFAVNTESPVESKIQMIDMNQFNEIMLKPFYSLKEYARNNNIGNVLEDGSNLEDFVKGEIINDEMSSLHSDASLPDVISELLKRNIISEPFKFDTGSNVNSTTISSESTMSVLALSKIRTKEKKPNVMFENKGNVAETSDTLSISSNPDLENAFKKLGMGWASSTLKKTKERLALSSSSNTSSSSLAQFKIKSFNQDIPVLVTDSVSSALKVSSKSHSKRNGTDVTKHAEQQTSAINSIFTVKEFLNNELAKKITFNKSRNDTEEEFVSLFETKMPEDMKQASRVVREDSMDNSVRSNNRARTSTPVQLFKSMTFQSSSSSNISNGLFSNADDLSSVKHTSNSMKNHSTSEKDDLTIPNFSLRVNKNGSSD